MSKYHIILKQLLGCIIIPNIQLKKLTFRETGKRFQGWRIGQGLGQRWGWKHGENDMRKL